MIIPPVRLITEYVGMIGEGLEVFADTGDIDVTFETIEP